jgi:hypothetical protein
VRDLQHRGAHRSLSKIINNSAGLLNEALHQAFERHMDKYIDQESLLSRAELIESVQEHFYKRLGNIDWNDSTELTGEFTGFTLWPEEIEGLLNQVPSGRLGVAAILESMNITNKQLRRIKAESSRKEQAIAEAEIVERFKLNVEYILGKQKAERKNSGRTEFSNASCTAIA